MIPTRQPARDYVTLVYELILRGKPYEDILKGLKQERQKQIISAVLQYRKIESRDMTYNQRAQLTGLKRSTCERLNKVYQEFLTVPRLN